MRLIYIYHSSYALETQRITIIFDYYKDSEDSHQSGIVYNEILKNTNKLYVFSSHSHPDHFNPEILSWKENNPNITYIFSKDILDGGFAKLDDAVYLDKLESYKDDNLSVKAFGSTDLGVSFLVEIEGKTIFHAGDLNNWHWNEESTEAEIKEAEAFYESELNLISESVKHIDLAMFPVDPRLGKDYMKGAEQFLSAITVDILAPMHFGDVYSKAAAFFEFAASRGCKCICWQYKGESVSF